MTLLNTPILDTELEYIEWNEGHFRAVNKFYKSQKHKSSAGGDERVFVARQSHTDQPSNTDIVAAVRLVPYQGYYWLRSLYVAKTLQGKSIGSKLLSFVHQNIPQAIHCFPYTHLENFYTQSGYALTELEHIPQPLQQLYERYNRKGDSIIIMNHSISSCSDIEPSS
jgi:GNAT superfamily N-acetyltransferase